MNEIRDGWHGDADQNAGSGVSALTLPNPQVASVCLQSRLHVPLALLIELAWSTSVGALAPMPSTTLSSRVLSSIGSAMEASSFSGFANC